MFFNANIRYETPEYAVETHILKFTDYERYAYLCMFRKLLQSVFAIMQ